MQTPLSKSWSGRSTPSMTRRPPSLQEPYGDGGCASSISVVDEYDTKVCFSLGDPPNPALRARPTKSPPECRYKSHPNILFNRVVNCQNGENEQPCSSQYAACNDEDDQDCRCNTEPCAPPLDWDHYSTLRDIRCEDRQAYRQRKLEEYLRDMCARNELHGASERFDDYLIRCYAYANDELNKNSTKHAVGYLNNWSVLDVWVMRLYKGAMARLARAGTAYSDREHELLLSMLREECVALSSEQSSVLRARLKQTQQQLKTSDDQERNYKKILLLSQCNRMGAMQALKRRDWR
uniref:Uncharacterized protein n=1 Tax=Physcomitrium patens TaxID=3218 RepID=A0A2K1KVG0_PHYPA|nr:hypothetical protein PHYPA_004763 [Physcomitrium patens]